MKGVLLAMAVSWLGACGGDRAGLTPHANATPDASAAGSGAAGTGAAGTGIAGTGVASGAAGAMDPDVRDGGTGGSTGTAGASEGGVANAVAGAGGADAGQGGAVDAGAQVATAAVGGCTQDGWCWSTPSPQGNDLYSVWGSSATDVWAVGEAGSIVHWDGTAWTEIPSGVHGVLRGVWASGTSDAWAVGENATILRWNGTAWARAAGVPATGYHWRAVWGTNASDLWIAGDDTSVPTQNGYGGAMLHWNGSAWTMYTAAQSFGAIWGTGSNDVWGLGGDADGLFHWDGKKWSTVPTPDLPQIGTAIWGSSAGDLWLGARSTGTPNHWNGTSLSLNANNDVDVDGLWGSGANDVWAVGDSYPDFFGDGMILHWNGVSWDRMPSNGASHLFGIWGTRTDDVWAVGEAGAIVHWNGGSWSPPPGPPRVNLFSLWASGSDDVWAFGYDRAGLGALHWNGQAWAKTELLDVATIGASSGSSTAPYAAWGSSANDLWVGATDWEPVPNRVDGSTARAVFVHWNGQKWSKDSSLEGDLADSLVVNSMWGSGPNDVWAAGVADGATADLTGTAVHWDGTSWSRVTSLSDADLAHPFRSLWTSGPKDVWIGADGVVLHWDGVSWSKPLSDPAGGSFIVGGSGPADVWAVLAGGDSASASRWNGVSWQLFPVTGAQGPLHMVATSPTSAWLRTDEAVYHWDGVAWTTSDAGTNGFSTNLVWDGKEIWAGAMWGLLRHP
jgi:hypothetical protein